MGYETAPSHSFRPSRTRSLTTPKRTTTATHAYSGTDIPRSKHTPPSLGGLYGTRGTRTYPHGPHAKHGSPCWPWD
eukprot:3780318-Pyramimonas_sp.AAC.1